jgi:surface antigen
MSTYMRPEITTIVSGQPGWPRRRRSALSVLLTAVFVISASLYVAAGPATASVTDWASSSFCSSNHVPYMGTTYNGVAACGNAYPNNYQGKISYNGVEFDSVGFQCVELAARYFYYVTGQHPPLVQDASDYAYYLAADGGYGVYPTGLTGGTNTFQSSLTPGNIISMWSASDQVGHVAVVTKVNVTGGKGTIKVMDENAAASGTDAITVSGGKMSYEGIYPDFQWTTNLPGSGSPLPPQSPQYETAFEANTSSLWSVGEDPRGAWGLGMMNGTSPAITAVNGSNEVAFQANTGSLWTVGEDPHGAWGLGMMPGTSPAITSLAGGGYEVAFQANTGSLWTVGAGGDVNWGLGMMNGTSPAITGLAGGGYEVAFQANTGSLWTVGQGGGSSSPGALGLGMMNGTTPAITAVNGSYEVAFQANTGSLWTVGEDPHGAWGLGMMNGTSPAITAVNGSYEVAFQANTGSLWTVGEDPHGAWGLGMMNGTSPAITSF